MTSTIDEASKREICILVGIERVQLKVPNSNERYYSPHRKKINDYLNELIINPTKLEEKWADYIQRLSDYWGKMESWSVIEAALVSLEIDPREIKKLKKPLKYHSMPCLKDYFEAKIANEYLDRVDLIVSKYQQVEVEHSPMRFLEWFESKEIDFPQECARNIRKYCQIEDYKKLFIAEQLVSHSLKTERDQYKEEADKAKKSKSAQTKETDNLRIITYLLATKAFPNLQSDSNYASKIASYLHTQGFDISDETVRKQYKEGQSLYKKKAVID